MCSAKPYWIEHVEAWKASGLKRKEYAATHGLDFKNFGWWTWKLEQEGYGPYAKPPRPGKTDGQKTKKIDPSTPQVLTMWAAGIPVEVIATETGISPNAVRIRAGNHKAKRPAWYLSAIRGKANPQGVQA
jgi:hypothetical protein